jgi:hypothetical protein
MNINVYDNINSVFPKERENYVRRTADNMLRPDYNGDMPAFPAPAPLAMAYVPFQNWGDTKSPEDALECGTLFSDLVYPFKRGGDNR